MNFEDTPMNMLPIQGLAQRGLWCGVALVLTGCAGLRNISSEVSSFGEWPADRKPGTYAFERLPSQAALPAEATAIEAAALPALAQAGFSPVASGQQPDVLVQVGARTSLTTLSPWADPLWWRGGFGYWRAAPWPSSRWSYGLRAEFPRYEREVALLIRERGSGKPLFEARASSEGSSDSYAGLMTAMFNAALMDFPKLGLNPRTVVTTLP
jgi:hypothetical protein